MQQVSDDVDEMLNDVKMEQAVVASAGQVVWEEGEKERKSVRGTGRKSALPIQNTAKKSVA